MFFYVFFMFFYVFSCFFMFIYVFLFLLSDTYYWFQRFSGDSSKVFNIWFMPANRWKIFGSNMEMEPDPAEQVSETSWHPEIVVLVRDVKVRLYVKREGCLPDWQSQWVAGDAWLASRADIAATICSEKDKNSQLHSARNFGWFGVAEVFSNTNTKDCSI